MLLHTYVQDDDFLELLAPREEASAEEGWGEVCGKARQRGGAMKHFEDRYERGGRGRRERGRGRERKSTKERGREREDEREK
jgi:hypothetical protein